MSAHTPTPWRIDPSYIADIQSSDGRDDLASTCVARGETQELADIAHANAAHIVRCVNAHDELVAALRALVEYYDGWDELASRVQEMETARAVLAKLEAS